MPTFILLPVGMSPDDAATETAQPVDAGRFKWEHAMRVARPEGCPPGEWPGPSLPSRGLAFVLGSHLDNRTGRARIGVPRLAREAGCSKSTVHSHLAALQAAGWLRKVSRGHGYPDGSGVPNVWQATIPAIVQQTIDAAKSVPPETCGTTSRILEPSHSVSSETDEDEGEDPLGHSPSSRAGASAPAPAASVRYNAERDLSAIHPQAARVVDRKIAKGIWLTRRDLDRPKTGYRPRADMILEVDAAQRRSGLPWSEFDQAVWSGWVTPSAASLDAAVDRYRRKRGGAERSNAASSIKFLAALGVVLPEDLLACSDIDPIIHAIHLAREQEEDNRWRRILLLASGEGDRAAKEVFARWHRERSSIGSVEPMSGRVLEGAGR